MTDDSETKDSTPSPGLRRLFGSFGLGPSVLFSVR